jgi:hypothetical protein
MKTNDLDMYINNQIIKSAYRQYDVPGSPFKIGDLIIVLDSLSRDSTFDIKYIGEKGIVIFFEYDCGCGQTFPSDPMIGVRFPNLKVEEFWKEEIQLVKP